MSEYSSDNILGFGYWRTGLSLYNMDMYILRFRKSAFFDGYMARNTSASEELVCFCYYILTGPMHHSVKLAGVLLEAVSNLLYKTSRGMKVLWYTMSLIPINETSKFKKWVGVMRQMAYEILTIRQWHL